MAVSHAPDRTWHQGNEVVRPGPRSKKRTIARERGEINEVEDNDDA
ncbi:MAG: hypothetical protein AAGG65_16425 [Pseudomonadota bacterium]